MALSRYRYRNGSVAARVVSAIFAIIATILILHILFVVLDANDGNPIVHTISELANTLAYLFKDIFTLDDARWQAVLNYGLATVVYLFIGGLIGGLIDRDTD